MQEKTRAMTLSCLFECGIRAEKALQKFYLALAKKFSSRPEIFAFWKTMSDEEAMHAMTLESARKNVSEEKLNEFIDDMMAQRGRSLSKLSSLDISLLNSIRDLDEAYQAAHELESSDINVVFSFLKLKLIPDGENNPFSSISIEHHVQKLMDFPKTFGDSQMRKSIKAEQ